MTEQVFLLPALSEHAMHMDGDTHGAVQEAQGLQDGASVQDAQTETVKTAAVGNGALRVRRRHSR